MQHSVWTCICINIYKRYLLYVFWGRWAFWNEGFWLICYCETLGQEKPATSLEKMLLKMLVWGVRCEVWGVRHNKTHFYMTETGWRQGQSLSVTNLQCHHWRGGRGESFPLICTLRSDVRHCPLVSSVDWTNKQDQLTFLHQTDGADRDSAGSERFPEIVWPQ